MKLTIIKNEVNKKQESDFAKLFDNFDLKKYYQENPIKGNREIDWGNVSW